MIYVFYLLQFETKHNSNCYVVLLIPLFVCMLVTGWTDWGECTDTCGGGQQYKLRYTVTNYETWSGRTYRQLVV